jgi:hypothetical protein
MKNPCAVIIGRKAVARSAARLLEVYLQVSRKSFR